MTSPDELPAVASPEAFVTTKWTRVMQARGSSVEAKAALSDLCGAYYAPVLHFITRCQPDPEGARDLTQEFFARILARQGIDTVNPQRGRFRSYLLGAVKHFLADMRAGASRQKRGANISSIPIGVSTETSPAFDMADAKAAAPDMEFDRKWALTVLERSLAKLEAEHAGKADQFQVLKPWLTGETEGLSQAQAAVQLGMNEGAVKVAVHRLRRRFRELVKHEVGHTLTDPGQVEDELACLLAALGG